MFASRCHNSPVLIALLRKKKTGCCLHLQSEEYPAQAGISHDLCTRRLVSLTLAAHSPSPGSAFALVQGVAGTSSHRKITRHRGPCCAQGPGNSQWNSSDRSPFDFSHRPRSCTKMSGMLAGVKQLVTRQLCLCHT